MISAPLTPDERRTVLVATVMAAATALATGLVTWAIDEAKAAVKRRWPPEPTDRGTT